MTLTRRDFIKGLSSFGALTLLPSHAFSLESGPSGKWTEHVRPLMGSFVGVAIYSQDRATADLMIEQTFQFIESNVSQISEWELGSWSSKLNAERQLSNTVAPTVLKELLRRAVSAQKLTSDLFMPLSLSLTKLWRDAREAQTPPHPADIARELKTLSNSNFGFERDALRITGAGEFDSGGVGKGFIADLATTYLRESGVKFARIDCGGDMRFLGDTRWDIEVENPRAVDERQMLGRISLRGSQGIATSGDYRNYFFYRGKRFHHLLDPRSGMPGGENQQVTVVHSSATMADALATAIFFLTPSEGLDLLKRIPSAEGLIVDSKHQLHHTTGLKFRRY